MLLSYQDFSEKRKTGNLENLLMLIRQLTVERSVLNTCIFKTENNATGLEIDLRVFNTRRCLKTREF